MGRSGYNDDCDQWDLIRWRGAVASAIRGKRGQTFLREMLAALDALPAPRLIAQEIEENGEVCALGSVGRKRGLDLDTLDPYDHSGLASTFGVSEALVREIEDTNDEWRHQSPEDRFARMRAWVIEQIRADSAGTDSK